MDYMNLHQLRMVIGNMGSLAQRMHVCREKSSPGIGKKRRFANGLALDAQCDRVFESQHLQVCRFGDNMREVAVTGG